MKQMIKRCLAIILTLVIVIGLMPQISMTAGATIVDADASGALGYGFNALKNGTELPELTDNICTNRILEDITVRTRDYGKTSTHYLYASSKEEFIRTYTKSKSIGINASIPIKAVTLKLGAKFGTAFESNYTETGTNLLETFYSDNVTRKSEIMELGGIKGAKQHLSNGFLDAVDEIRNEANAEARNVLIDSLFRVYGTHAVTSVFLGGTLEICNHVYTEEKTSVENLKTEDTLSAGIKAGDLSIGTEYTESTSTGTSLTTNLQKEIGEIHAFGANYPSNILTTADYRQWQAALQNSSWIVGFDEDSLIPVWKLVDAALGEIIYARYIELSTEIELGSYIYESPEMTVKEETVREYSVVPFADVNYAAPGSTIWFPLSSENIEISLRGNAASFAEIDDPRYGMLRIKPTAPENSPVTVDFKVGNKVIETVVFTVMPEGRSEGSDLQRFAGGYGTKERPYLIATADHMESLRSMCSVDGCCFKMISDVPLDADFGLIPTFKGTLDGNNHAIENWEFTHEITGGPFEETGYWGFFKYNFGIIQNLVFRNAKFSVTYDKNVSTTLYGAIVCGKNSGTIRNVSVRGDSSAYASVGIGGENNNESHYTYTGGIVGMNVSRVERCSVIGCSVTARVIGWNSNHLWSSAGGVVGLSYKSGNTIENCYSKDNHILSKVRTASSGGGFLGIGWFSGRPDAASGSIVSRCNDGAVIRNCISDSTEVQDYAQGYLDDGSEIVTWHQGEGGKPTCGHTISGSIRNLVANNVTQIYDHDSIRGHQIYTVPGQTVSLSLNSLDAAFESEGWRRDEETQEFYFAKDLKDAPGSTAFPFVRSVSLDTIELLDLPIFEYKLDDQTEWTSAARFTGLEPGSTHYLYVRFAEDETHAASTQSNEIVITMPDYDLTISGLSQYCYPGQTFTMPITAARGAEIAGFTLSVQTDDTLTLTGIERGAMLKAAGGSFIKNPAQGLINWNNPAGATADGELLLLTFTVSDAAQIGSEHAVSIRLKDEKPSNLSDPDSDPVLTEFIDSTIVISPVLFGDTNTDWDVDSADAVRLLRSLVLLEELTEDQRLAADLDRDEDVTSSDAILLTRYLARFIDRLDLLTPSARRSAVAGVQGGSINVGSAVTKNGGTVSLPVSITGNPGFAGFTLQIDAPDGWEIAAVERGAVLNASESGSLIANLAQGVVNWNDIQNVSGDGVLFTLTLNVSQSAEEGDYPVGVSLMDGKAGNFVTEDGAPVLQTYQTGTVTVDNHEHIYVPTVTPATCTEQGYTTYTCSCGDSYVTDYVDPLGHDLTHHEAQAPTCTAVGWAAYDDCSRCIYSTYVEIKALDHDLISHKAKTPTCTEIGWEAYETCSRCDYSTYAEIKALGHDLVSYEAKMPTCTEIGWEEFVTCSRCDYSTYVEIEALGHDLIHHEAQEATCTEIGWAAYDTCSRCDYSTYVEIEALGHDLIHHEAKAATCSEIGWEVYDTCSRCDYTTYKEIAALDHDLIHHEDQAPTCTEIGWKAYDTCSRCDFSTYTEIEALGHDLIHHEAKTATCTKIGWEAYDTCSRCDYTTYEAIPATGHMPADAVRENEVAPTCTEAGGYDEVIYCSVCSAELSREHVKLSATGHDWTEPTYSWSTDNSKVTASRVCKNDGSHTETETVYTTAEVTKKATCTEPGDTTYTAVFQNAAFAKQTKTVTNIAALGHALGTPVKENETVPTCTEVGGYDTVVYCVVCGTELSRDHTEIKATGHDWNEPTYTWEDDNSTVTATRICKNDEKHIETETVSTTVEIVEAGCTSSGNKTYTASFKNLAFEMQTKTVAIDPAGHHASEAVRENEAAPTCTETGSYDEVVYCSVCGAELSRETKTIDALGHDLVHHDAQEATCTEIGWAAYDTCTRCDYTTYEEIPATGHTPADAVKENEIAATCTETGSYDEVVYCSVCGAELSRETKTIDALGHDLVHHDAQAATCTDIGWAAYDTCTRCDYTTYEEIPATGHAPAAAVRENEVAPTCTETGSYDEVVYCSDCGVELSREKKTVDALGHDLVTDPAVAATCTATGLTEGKHCTRCDYKVAQEVVPMTPHSYKDGKCTVCGAKDPDYKPPVTTNPFNDVKEGEFYYEAVLWAVNADPQVTAGTSATTFSPNATCTRAQVVTFLWRAKGCPEPKTNNNPFNDVKAGDYYYKAVLWAVENGITAGTSATTFSPNAGCTRAQVVTFLWRTEGQPKPNSSSNPFKDVKGGYYYDAVLWAVEKGITAGTSATTFSPDATCTRGQIVTFLYRAFAA